MAGSIVRVERPRIWKSREPIQRDQDGGPQDCEELAAVAIADGADDAVDGLVGDALGRVAQVKEKCVEDRISGRWEFHDRRQDQRQRRDEVRRGGWRVRGRRKCSRGGWRFDHHGDRSGGTLRTGNGRCDVRRFGFDRALARPGPCFTHCGGEEDRGDKDQKSANCPTSPTAAAPSTASAASADRAATTAAIRAARVNSSLAVSTRRSTPARMDAMRAGTSMPNSLRMGYSIIRSAAPSCQSGRRSRRLRRSLQAGCDAPCPRSRRPRSWPAAKRPKPCSRPCRPCRSRRRSSAR